MKTACLEASETDGGLSEQLVCAMVCYSILTAPVNFTHQTCLDRSDTFEVGVERFV